VTLDPVTLVESEILYSDDRHVVWHAGVTLGPTGAIVLNLEIDSPNERMFRVDPAWRTEGPPPIDSYIEIAGIPGPIEGSFSNSIDRFAFHFQKWFQPIDRERLSTAELHIQIHPLGLHLVRHLSPE
jgi:hypothetical protein